MRRAIRCSGESLPGLCPYNGSALKLARRCWVFHMPRRLCCIYAATDHNQHLTCSK